MSVKPPTIQFQSTTFHLHPDGEYYNHPPALRSHPVVQKQEALGKDRLRLHRAKDKTVDEGDRRRFLGSTVDVTFYISDKRTRDLSGMMETVMDCLTMSGAIPDDNWRDVTDQAIHGRECPKGEERVVVKIIKPNS